MTFGEWQKADDIFDSQLKEITHEREELRKRFLSNCEFKAGDHVALFKNGQFHHGAYIKNVRVGFREDKPFNFDFWKEKKDGTQSQIQLYFGGWDRIEKIK